MRTHTSLKQTGTRNTTISNHKNSTITYTTTSKHNDRNKSTYHIRQGQNRRTVIYQYVHVTDITATHQRGRVNNCQGINDSNITQSTETNQQGATS